MSKKKKIILIITISLIILAIIGAIIAIVSIRKSKEYYNEKVALFKEENKNASNGQIVFLGDSITDLCPLNEYYSDLSLLTYNRGIGGDSTAGLLNRLDVSAYDIKPSKIVLMIGINDINGKISDEIIISNYDKILGGIKSNLPDTEVYVMSILSQSKTVEQYGIKTSYSVNRVKTINNEIKKLSNKYSYTYVDLFSITVDSNDLLIEEYTFDGLHLSEKGFEIWADTIKPYLQ